MKIFIALLFFTFLVSNPNLTEIRESFKKAAESKDAADIADFYQQLEAVQEGDQKVLVAYKGAALAMKSKHEKDKELKKQNFKDGVALIELAVAESPEDIEIRFVRLSVQENTPPFLKYKANLEEDKSFILSHYQQITSANLKALIQSYAAQSKVISTEELKSIP